MQQLQEALLSELLARGIECLYDTVAEDDQRVASLQGDVARRAAPFLEQANDRSCRGKAFNPAVASKHDRWNMTTVRVGQAFRVLVVDCEEERRIKIPCRALEECSVHRVEDAQIGRAHV